MNIDELRGRELAIAVILARGYTPSPIHMPESWYCRPDGEGVEYVAGAHDDSGPLNDWDPNRPDRNLGQAGTLLDELRPEWGVKIYTVGKFDWAIGIHTSDQSLCAVARTQPGVPDESLATAICRAYLKAKEGDDA